MGISSSKTVEKQIEQEYRIAEKFFVRFATELEQRTKRKFKVSHGGLLHEFFDMYLKEHIGFMRNKKRLQMRLGDLTREKIELIVWLSDETLLQDVQALMKEYEQRLEHLFKRKVDISFYKHF